jgi:hypothetical protein
VPHTTITLLKAFLSDSTVDCDDTVEPETLT